MPRKGKTRAERMANQIKATSSIAVRAARAGVKMYCPQICDEIIMRVADGKETLFAVCQDERMPSWMTVHRWMEQYPEWRERVQQAREMARMRIEDEVLTIADDSDGDTKRDRLRIDTRFKIMERQDAKERELNKPQDPKVLEATKDEGGEWRTADNGERLNPISDALENFRRKAGINQ